MRILVDGCDGSGKSTLTKYLANELGLDVLCLTKNSESSIERYSSLLNIDDIIFDRSFLSENIYCKIFNRKAKITKKGISFLIDYYLNQNVLFIICTAPDDVIKDRIQKRGFEYKEIVDNINFINESYKQLAKKYNFLLIDTSKLELHDIYNVVKKELGNLYD